MTTTTQVAIAMKTVTQRALRKCVPMLLSRFPQFLASAEVNVILATSFATGLLVVKVTHINECTCYFVNKIHSCHGWCDVRQDCVTVSIMGLSSFAFQYNSQENL